MEQKREYTIDVYTEELLNKLGLLCSRYKFEDIKYLSADLLNCLIFALCLLSIKNRGSIKVNIINIEYCIIPRYLVSTTSYFKH